MERVSVGMSGRRVREVLGDPLAVEGEREEETESWYYESGVVIFRRGKVTFRGPVPDRSRR
jgi:outer membrane protein assembly factor BamE (lipoprotein component of BamABCDE complex)